MSGRSIYPVAALVFLASSWAGATPTPDVGPVAAERGVLLGASTDPMVVTACDPRERNWRSALQAIARLGGERGTRGLAAVVRQRLGAARGDGDTDERVRDALVLLGQRRGSASAVDAVSFALASSDAGVRYAAVDALGSIGSASARDQLLTLLDRDGEPLVAAAALASLVRIGGSAEPRLRELLVDSRAAVRSAAAIALFRTLRPAELRGIDPEATELHALRLLSAAKRVDLESLGEFVHPMRRLEIMGEDHTASFSARTLTPSMLRQEIAPVLASALPLADSLACGEEHPGHERHCAVYDPQGYVTEMHFTTVLGHLYLIRVKHHGGYADL